MPSFTTRRRPYCVCQRSLASGSRASARYAPASTSAPTSRTASRANPRKASRRRDGASGHTRNASAMRPPAHTDAATRWSQSAPCASQAALPSVAWCPDSDRPDASASERTSAGHRSSGRSRIQASKSTAATIPKPSVIARNAMPKRVFSANGCRSPYRRSPSGSCNAFDARRTNATIPTSITRNAAATPSRWKPRSTRAGTGPRTTTRRTTSGPIRSASATNRAQRATSSRQVAAEAPTASVGGGAATPTPNVKTPAGACPSAPITRQRTV